MTLAMTVLRRRWVEARRYPADTVATILSYYVLFLVLFFGMRAFGPADLNRETTGTLIVGYVALFLTNQSYNAFYGQIQQEAQLGTLEQLALARYGLLPVLLSDFTVQTGLLVGQYALVLVSIMATTGRWLEFDVVSLVATMLPTMAGVVGLGLMMGGVGLIAKRASSIGGLIGFAFFFFIAAPVDRYPVLKLLPIGHGRALLDASLVDHEPVLGKPADLAMLVAVSALYFLGGAAVFGRCERKARQHGSLGHY